MLTRLPRAGASTPLTHRVLARKLRHGPDPKSARDRTRHHPAGLFDRPFSDGRKCLDDPSLFWVDPEERGVFPLDGLVISRSLAKTVRSDTFRDPHRPAISTAIVDGCAESAAPGRDGTWINQAHSRSLLRACTSSGFVHTDRSLAGRWRARRRPVRRGDRCRLLRREHVSSGHGCLEGRASSISSPASNAWRVLPAGYAIRDRTIWRRWGPSRSRNTSYHQLLARRRSPRRGRLLGAASGSKRSPARAPWSSSRPGPCLSPERAPSRTPGIQPTCPAEHDRA